MTVAFEQETAASLPDYPEDAELPSGEAGVSFVLKAAEDIKSKGNALFKQVQPDETLHTSLLCQRQSILAKLGLC